MRLFFSFLVVMMSISLNAGFLEKESIKAQKEKKLILLTVESESCPYCIKMRKDTFEVKKYRQKIAKQYIHVIIYDKDKALPDALYVKYLPTNFILSPKELRIIDEFPGYITPDHFIELLEEVYSQEHQ